MKLPATGKKETTADPVAFQDRLTVICGDALESLLQLPDQSVQCCVTSPPYWGLRDYGHAGQFGLEKTPGEYVAKIVAIFREVSRVLKDDGTLWLNLGDSYCSQGGLHDGRDDNQPGVGAKRVWRNGSGCADGIVDERGQRNRNGNSVAGLKPKDLVGIPWMVAFALRDDGWYLRQEIVWAKDNPMPESVTDRCTRSHEKIFMLTKSGRYFYDAEAIQEPCSMSQFGRVRDDVVGGKNGDQVRHSPGGRYKTDKQRGHSRRHDGFNARWDAMEKAEQCSGMRNKRDVWNIAVAPYPDAHFATYPPDLVQPCILAGSKGGDVILDPFAGSGTTGMVALELGRKAVLIELNPSYVDLIRKRCDVTPGFEFQ